MLSDYLKLCRVSNLPTIWTNVLAAVVLSGAEFSAFQFFVPALSMLLFYSGGMCLNDVVDSNRDRVKRPSRPIPSAKISRFNAALFSAILLLSALLILAISSYPKAFSSGMVLLLFIVGYNLFHNRYKESILLMAGCRFMVFAVTAAAVQGRVGELVLAAGIVQFLYTVGISYTARVEKDRQRAFSFPLIPVMIAGFSLLDGLLLSVLIDPLWFSAGLFGAILTLAAQKFVRGD